MNLQKASTYFAVVLREAFSFMGLCPRPHKGLCPWSPLGKAPDPHYGLAHHARYVSPSLALGTNTTLPQTTFTRVSPKPQMMGRCVFVTFPEYPGT